MSALGGVVSGTVAPVHPVTPEAGIVSASTLNVRQGPGTAYPLAGKLSAGAMVNIYESAGGWLRIAETSEWIAERYVIKVRKSHVLSDSLNIRSGPGARFQALGSLPKNTEVLVYETQDGWCRIDINEKWVSAQYLSE